MYGTITQDDCRITPITVHKRFTAQKYDTVDNTSYLGVMALKGVSGSASDFHNTDFTEGNTTPLNTFVSGGRSFTFYQWCVYNQVKQNFFNFARFPNTHNSTAVMPQYTLSNYHRPWGRGLSTGGIKHCDILGLRQIHDMVNVVSIPQRLYGEGIRTGSIEITDYSTDGVITIKDDGRGNLYDANFETNYISASLDGNGSGSAVGTVSYGTGMIMITDTGSYTTVTQGTGSNGWKVKFDSTKTIYEHEYTVIIPENQFNGSTNVSVTKERSGSIDVPSTVFSDGNNTLRQILPGAAESQYDGNIDGGGYSSTPDMEPFTTHSFFAPYVTTVGLYNDVNDLLAIAKVSRPVRNDPELALSFVVRFDI
jgi:hypothetical protein